MFFLCPENIETFLIQIRTEKGNRVAMLIRNMYFSWRSCTNVKTAGLFHL